MKIKNMKNARALPLLFALFAVFCAFPTLGLAQKALTFDDCVKEATAHNPDLLSAEKSLGAADDTHIASLGQFFPQISFNASIGRNGFGGSNNALNSPSYNQNADLSLNAQQDIFKGFTDFASVDQSNAQLDLARAQLTQAKAQVSHDLKTAFYNLLFSQKQIDLLGSITDRQKANRDLVEMNFKGGTDNKGSFLQAQAAYDEALFELNQAKRNLRVSQKQLDQVLGRKTMDEVVAEGDFDVPTLSDNAPNFDQLTLKTPAHLQSLAQLHLSESQYVTARGAFLPTLSANASLFQSGYNFDETQPGWSAGLELSMPLFTGGKDLFNFKSAEESKQSAADNLESQDLKTEAALENSYASYADAVDQIQVLESQLTAAQTQEEIAKAEYLNGLMIFVNWNQIENSLTAQEKAQLSGYVNEKTAEANWELTQGKGVIP